MRVIDDNVFPDKIAMKKISKYYKGIEKLLEKDPRCVFFSMYVNNPTKRSEK